MTILNALVALLPVGLFLVSLRILDSFKLIGIRRVCMLVLAGAGAALISWWINGHLVDWFSISESTFRRYVAPPVEELLKSVVPLLLLRRRAVGFLVDAAICGFAVGAGFAIFENLYYLSVMDDAQPSVWAVRGFGTALMHGAVTATFALRVKQLWDEHGPRWSSVVRALFLATLVHSVFNHFFLRPDLSTLVLLLVLPIYFYWVFRKSEQKTRVWLRSGFDSDAQLLQSLNEGELATTAIGGYIKQLRHRFAPAMVVDLVCLLRVRLELSIRAKGLLMMREAGFEPEPDPAALAQLAELEHLRRSVGATGWRALAPLFQGGERELWEQGMLRKR